MLGGIHQHERHGQRVGQQQGAPRWPDPSPQEHRDHRGHGGVQRRYGRNQVDAGLTGVQQRPGRLQMQGSPAAGRDALDELVSAGLPGVHGAQQTAVGNASCPVEHAWRVRRTTGNVGRRATRRRPRRRGRQHHVDGQRREGQGDEPPDEGRPCGSVAQPEHAGHDVGQHEERHVDAADDHFPPRRLCELDVLLQPHRRNGAEEQPAICLWLKPPERVRAEHVGGTATEVVEHQDEGEGQPVADHR